MSECCMRLEEANLLFRSSGKPMAGKRLWPKQSCDPFILEQSDSALMQLAETLPRTDLGFQQFKSPCRHFENFGFLRMAVATD